MIITLSTTGGTPAEQIHDQIRGLITTGALAANERLPSIRQLAADLRVAPGTIANVGPEILPAMPAEEQESVPAKDEPAATAAPATKPTAKPAKLTRAPAKKPRLASVKPAKTPIRRPVKTTSKGVAPFKGSWSALLGGPTPSPAVKTQR